MNEDTHDSYFNRVINETKKELIDKGSALVYLSSQVEELKKYFPTLQVKYEDDIYYLKLPKTVYKS